MRQHQWWHVWRPRDPVWENATRARWLFASAWILILIILAVRSTNAQTGKNGPLAKLTHALVLLHAQHPDRLAQRFAVPFSYSESWLMLWRLAT